MQIGMIGLGKMGANMVRRLISKGHECFVYDKNSICAHELAACGAHPCESLDELVHRMSGPRIIWLMVPAGDITQKAIEDLSSLMHADDILIDGGNSFYQDDLKRAQFLNSKGVHFLDVGTSGGVFGKDRGYCLMIGGSENAFRHCEPIFHALSPATSPIEPGVPTSQNGYLYCGPTGSGHFAKMIHNGIEYGIMQAYAEGFDILKGASKDHIPKDRRYDFNLSELAEVWRHGSVISSWLLDLTAKALQNDSELKAFSGHVADSGEGRWTVNAAVEEGVSAEVLTSSLYKRFRSQSSSCFADKLLSALRLQFGGHKESK